MSNNRKPHFIILGNEVQNDHDYWVKACEAHKDKCTYSIVDLTSSGWLEIIKSTNCDYLLAKPGGLTSAFKQFYDERVLILTKILGLPIFPSLDEILIYENKRFFSYWLKANELPSPQTDVFYHKNEALKFIEKAKIPIVTKINIGASGSGVKILKSTEETKQYIKDVFSKGVVSKSGPRLDKGKILNRVWRKITHPDELKNRLTAYKSVASDIQKNFIIFQEYIPHKFEWRVVRIGDSFFAHKKVVRGEMASGLLLKEYDDPPKGLLTFVRNITDRFGFYSQAVDIFESPRGYLINEMQCIFGQSDSYQMLVNDKPGRYLFMNNQWIFEEGMFNTNKSYDLRIKYLLSKLTKKL